MTFLVNPRVDRRGDPDLTENTLSYYFKSINEAAPTVVEVSPPSLNARVSPTHKCHIKGYYVEVSANEDRAMTASQTNWLYIQLTRTSNQVTGAQLTHLTNPTEPAAPTDSVLLAKITTDATEITAIDTTVAWLNTNKETVKEHAFQHKKANLDPLLLHELGDPTASVEFNKQQLLQARVENRTTDAGTPSTGQLQYRTDLNPKALQIFDGTSFTGVGGGAWDVLDFAELASAATTLSTGTFAGKKNLMVIIFIDGMSVARVPDLQFNNDTGTDYAFEIDQIAVGVVSSSTGVNQTEMDIDFQANTTTPKYFVIFIKNLAAKLKQVSIYGMHTEATDDSQSPEVLLGAGVYNETTVQITDIKLLLDGAGNLNAGTSILVLGRDD